MAPSALPGYLMGLIMGVAVVIGVVSVLATLLKEFIFAKAKPRSQAVARDTDNAITFKQAPEYVPVPLLTPAEMSLYKCLVQLYGTSAVICPKVRLADVIQPRDGLGRSLFQSAFNRVSRKHLDFVIMRTDTLTVIGAIELDDRSHELKARIDRDTFVNDALEVAGIPLCRIKVQRGYHLETLCSQINAVFYPAQAAAMKVD